MLTRIEDLKNDDFDSKMTICGTTYSSKGLFWMLLDPIRTQSEPLFEFYVTYMWIICLIVPIWEAIPARATVTPRVSTTTGWHDSCNKQTIYQSLITLPL